MGSSSEEIAFLSRTRKGKETWSGNTGEKEKEIEKEIPKRENISYH